MEPAAAATRYLCKSGHNLVDKRVEIGPYRLEARIVGLELGELTEQLQHSLRACVEGSPGDANFGVRCPRQHDALKLPPQLCHRPLVNVLLHAVFWRRAPILV